MEKAREIKVKADEEFAIEKVRCSRFGRSCNAQYKCRKQGKIVRQETLNIDASFEKKRKQADIAKKMSVLLYSISLVSS